MGHPEEDYHPPPLPPFPPADPINPFETFMLIWIGLASMGFLSGDPGSKILQEILSETTVVLWGVALFFGSGLALIGLLIRRWTVAGWWFERGGILLVGGAAAIYGAVVWGNAADPNDVRYICGVQFGLATAALWRAVHITRRLRWTRRLRTVREG